MKLSLEQKLDGLKKAGLYNSGMWQALEPFCQSLAEPLLPFISAAPVEVKVIAYNSLLSFSIFRFYKIFFNIASLYFKYKFGDSLDPLDISLLSHLAAERYFLLPMLLPLSVTFLFEFLPMALDVNATDERKLLFFSRNALPAFSLYFYAFPLEICFAPF